MFSAGWARSDWRLEILSARLLLLLGPSAVERRPRAGLGLGRGTSASPVLLPGDRPGDRPGRLFSLSSLSAIWVGVRRGTDTGGDMCSGWGRLLDSSSSIMFSTSLCLSCDLLISLSVRALAWFLLLMTARLSAPRDL